MAKSLKCDACRRYKKKLYQYPEASDIKLCWACWVLDKEITVIEG